MSQACLCNSCGHKEAHHVDNCDGLPLHCVILGCPCRSFVPPGDADAYQINADTQQVIREAIDETRDIANQIPASYFHLLKVKQAADKLADAAKRSGGSEELMATIVEYERVRGL